MKRGIELRDEIANAEWICKKRFHGSDGEDR